jgi:DNA-binding CsgD family transcriptional regulator
MSQSLPSTFPQHFLFREEESDTSRSRPDHVALSEGLAVVIARWNGQIEFATSRALFCLAKYFNAASSRQLPPLLGNWMTDQSHASPLVINKKIDRLVVTLLDSDSMERRCLLLEEIDDNVDQRSLARHLTRREREVLSWVGHGKSNSDIAAILNLKIATVKKHLQRIYPKLGVENRTAAAYYAPTIVSSSKRPG